MKTIRCVLIAALILAGWTARAHGQAGDKPQGTIRVDDINPDNRAERIDVGYFLNHPPVFRVTKLTGKINEHRGIEYVLVQRIQQVSITPEGKVDLGQIVPGGVHQPVPMGSCQVGDLITIRNGQVVHLPKDHFDPLGGLAEEVKEPVLMRPGGALQPTDAPGGFNPLKGLISEGSLGWLPELINKIVSMFPNGGKGMQDTADGMKKIGDAVADPWRLDKPNKGIGALAEGVAGIVGGKAFGWFGGKIGGALGKAWGNAAGKIAAAQQRFAAKIIAQNLDDAIAKGVIPSAKNIFGPYTGMIDDALKSPEGLSRLEPELRSVAGQYLDEAAHAAGISTPQGQLLADAAKWLRGTIPSPPAGADDAFRGFPPPAKPGPPQKPPYVNNNPKATPDEIRVGEHLNEQAANGKLPGVQQVEGTAEIPGTRSGDYRFTLNNGKKVSADLYQPESGNPRSIQRNIQLKCGQAEIVVAEFGLKNSAGLGLEAAEQIAADVLRTPGHNIRRIIFMKDGKILHDTH